MPRAHLYGTPVSPGIALGTLHFLHTERFLDRHYVPESEVACEQELLHKAVEAVRQDLGRALSKVPADLREYREVIEAQIEMTGDPKLEEAAAKRIAQEKICAAWALQKTIDQLCDLFHGMDDPYLRDRAQDIRVVGLRIRDRLSGGSSIGTSAQDIILAAEDISPADVMELDLKRVRGILTQEGGPTSHTVILSRGLHIPALVCVTGLQDSAREGDPVIIDGLGGNVLIQPSDRDTSEYSRRCHEYFAWESNVRGLALWPADTEDGLKVSVKANIERPEEAAELSQFGADGIGLYRTEFSFMGQELPDEEQLYLEYTKVVRDSPGRTIIRTLDCGADKILKAQQALHEANPALGLRGVRFTLRRQDILRSQLRALLRAGVHGKISILLPLVTMVEEVRSVRLILQEVAQELKAKMIPHASDVPLGVMVETPAASLIADALARECDFFSIGTNDLIHYLMAIDRNNRHVAYLNEAMHPAIIRSLKRIIDAGHREGIKVGACGELSADPYGVVLMLGMGIDELSASPPFLPGIKHLIRRLNAQACTELAEQVLMSTDIPACKHMVNEMLQKTLGRELSFQMSTVMKQMQQ